MNRIDKEELVSTIDFSKIGMQLKEVDPRFRARAIRYIAGVLGVNLNDPWLQNALLDEGEQSVLQVYFRNTDIPAGFYLRLGNNGGIPGIPAETDTLTSITEVAGTGYTAQAVNRDAIDWSLPVLDAGDFQTESKVVTFTNTGGSDWTAADYAYLATSSDNTGKLISAVALSESRVVNPGNGLSTSMKQKGL